VATRIGDAERTARVMVVSQGELGAARIALGRDESPFWSRAAYIAGGVMAMLAASAILATSASWDDPDESRPQMLGFTIGFTVATAGLLGLGYALRADQQPGAVTQWAIAP
jgi:hypothetical protein